MISTLRSRTAVAGLALGFAGLASGSPCAAQGTPAPRAVAAAPIPAPTSTPKPTPTPATIGQPLQGSRVPDVQIVAILVPGGPQAGLWAVTAVYPKKVERGVAEGRMRRLLGLTGWRGSPLEFENRALDRAELSTGAKENLGRPLEPVPVMSSVTFTTPDRVVDGFGGTIVVEPFIRAYRDLNRVHITYLVPPQGFNFRGLRSYSDANVDIALSGGGNAYTYVVDIKNHDLDKLNLPRIQEVSAPTAKPTASGMPRGVAIALVTLLALSIGAVVFVVLRR